MKYLRYLDRFISVAMLRRRTSEMHPQAIRRVLDAEATKWMQSEEGREEESSKGKPSPITHEVHSHVTIDPLKLKRIANEKSFIDINSRRIRDGEIIFFSHGY